MDFQDVEICPIAIVNGLITGYSLLESGIFFPLRGIDDFSCHEYCSQFSRKTEALSSRWQRDTLPSLTAAAATFSTPLEPSVNVLTCVG
jgi:hypothetical protein